MRPGGSGALEARREYSKTPRRPRWLWRGVQCSESRCGVGTDRWPHNK